MTTEVTTEVTTEAVNVPAKTAGKRNDQMTLSECAQFDFNTKQKTKLTGWGQVSKDRRERGVSRKERRKQRNG